MTDIKSMTIEELRSYCETLGEKKFRADQLYSWMHQKLAVSFDEMTNLSKDFRQRLSEDATMGSLKILEVQTSQVDGTQKYLFETEDGQPIESVRMIYKHGISVCISSQVGCRMGCTFCASTIGGVVRSLTAAEMLNQIYMIQRESGERVSNVVVMGMGEPFDNYDALVRFLGLISHEKGLNISGRNITVSTCGLVPEMKRFADEGLQTTLALSLHASNQETRMQMMPIARRYDLTEVLEACGYFFRKTGRRVTFEYSLAAGVNDSDQNAEELVELIGDMNCHLNLIPINPVRENGYVQTDRDRILRFKNKLEKNGINVTIRREMGRDIDGACGQLRKRYKERQE